MLLNQFAYFQEVYHEHVHDSGDCFIIVSMSMPAGEPIAGVCSHYSWWSGHLEECGM